MSTTPSQPAAGEPSAASPGARAGAIRPRDAATLILVDRAKALPRVLLGRRRADMKFMPGKYVFPGGRVDKSDRVAAAADELAAHETSKLLVDMKGGASASKARALALAAIRETYEEAGIIIGTAHQVGAGVADASWRRFHEQGFLPRLAPLSFFARAITPPGRPRRFDTRFFCVEASAIAFQGTPPEDELSDLVWMSLEEARSLDLPPITRVILEDLGDRLNRGPLGDSASPVPYYFNRNGSFKRQLITLEGTAT
ncbi:MAG: NUDIX hydrolase [Hyphomicrobiaceae bacterium]|nr:NUDIX hydrolase [Hyphomicrobiaceae bacterium]